VYRVGDVTGRCTGRTGEHGRSWSERLWTVLTELLSSVRIFSGQMDSLSVSLFSGGVTSLEVITLALMM